LHPGKRLSSTSEVHVAEDPRQKLAILEDVVPPGLRPGHEDKGRNPWKHFELLVTFLQCCLEDDLLIQGLGFQENLFRLPEPFPTWGPVLRTSKNARNGSGLYAREQSMPGDSSPERLCNHGLGDPLSKGWLLAWWPFLATGWR
jgi:hypothetical protein